MESTCVTTEGLGKYLNCIQMKENRTNKDDRKTERGKKKIAFG
jgi:hypothetical protein